MQLIKKKTNQIKKLNTFCILSSNRIIAPSKLVF